MLHCLKQIEDAIRQFDMIKPNDKIIVGLSGGADSVALTHYLHFILKCSIVVCHVNHHLRGEESDRDMLFVESLCDEWGIPCFIKEADVSGFAGKNGLTLEEAGRSIRYDTFAELMISQNAQKIATAHTLSDSAETVLLNLTRGAGLRGLCGIPAKRDNIIRPLIGCTREDVEQYCKENKLLYVDDSTNSDTDFSRNNIRHNVIPVLKSINPAFYASIFRTIHLLNEDREYIEKQADSAKFFCQKNGDVYDVEMLREQDKPIRTRILSDILEENKIERSYVLLERLDSIVKTGGKQNVSFNKFAEIKGNRLWFGIPEEPLPYFESAVSPGDYVSPSAERFRIYQASYETVKLQEKVYKNLLFLCIDYDKIKGKLFVRQRKTGDEIEFSHRAGTKTLKKLFIDEHLTAYEKSKIPVFADDEGVVAVFGFGVALRAAADENTQRVLIVELL